jgi:hypothetical protein
MPGGLRASPRVSTGKLSITRSAAGYLGVSREEGNVFFGLCERVACASFRELLAQRGHPVLVLGYPLGT